MLRLPLFTPAVIGLAFALTLSAGLAACGPKTTHQTSDPRAENSPGRHEPGTDGEFENAIDPVNATPSPDSAESYAACTEFHKNLPSDWFHDRIEVPEDPAQPNGHRIFVHYYGKRVEGVTPIIFFNGGPNRSSFGPFKQLKEQVIARNLSFIFIDQRGTGCSSPYPSELERIALYGSRGIVGDAEAIRAHIWPDQRWIIFGHSYGASIVHRYVTQAPLAIQAAFAYAGTLGIDGYTRFLRRLQGQLRINEVYLFTYPEDRARLSVLAPRADVRDKFVSLLAFRDHWQVIHQWLETIVPATSADVPLVISQEGLARFVQRYPLSDPSTYSNLPVRRVTDWVDRDVPVFDTDLCRRIEHDLAQQGLKLSDAPINECALLLEKPWRPSPELMKRVEALPQDTMKLAQLKQALSAHTELSFHFYSSKLDTYVPEESFTEVARELSTIPNAHYTQFENSGHEGYSTESRVWDELQIATALRNSYK